MRQPAAAVETVLVSAGFVVLFLVLPHGLAGDDYTRFADIENLIHHGRLSSSSYSLVMPLASAPFLLLGEVIESPAWWAARFNVISVALGVVLAFRLLRGRVDPGLLRRTTLVLLFESLLTNRLRDYGAEVFTGTLVGLGILCLSVQRHALAGWAAIVLGVVNTPAAGGGLALLCAAATLRTRRVRYVAPLVAATALIMLEAWIRRGGPFVTGYEKRGPTIHPLTSVLPFSGRGGFSYPFLLGLLGILFSFGRGLLFFTPGLALWLDRATRMRAAAMRRALVPMLLFVTGLVLVYANWWAWYGGLSWGPRFFVFAALPASLLVASRLESSGSRWTTLFVLALSAWVGLIGAIDDFSTLAACSAHGYRLEMLCWYTPEYSSLWHPLARFPRLTEATWGVSVYFAVVFAWLASRTVRGPAVFGWPRAGSRCA